MLRRDPAEALAEADSSPVDPANYLKVSQLHRSDGDSTSGAAAGGLKLASRYIHENIRNSAVFAQFLEWHCAFEPARLFRNSVRILPLGLPPCSHSACG